LALSRGFKPFIPTFQTPVTIPKILPTLDSTDDMETSKQKTFFGSEDHISRMDRLIISDLL
jgi:hypothetical protein